MVEFILSLVGLPVDVLALITRKWILGKNLCVVSGSVVTTCGMTEYIPFICVSIDMYITITLYSYPVFMYANFFLGFASMMTLCVLSVARMKNFLYAGRISGKVSSYQEAFKIITIIWLLSLVLTLPPLLGWGRYIPEFSGLG